MKKGFRFVLLLLLLVGLAVSCSPDSKLDEAGTVNPGGVWEEDVELFLPVFDAADGGASKGLTSLSIAGMDNSRQLVETFPILQSLKKTTISNLDDLSSLLKECSTDIIVWGFRLSFDSMVINPDGFYSRFNLLDDKGNIIGFCDYYYNVLKRTFSLKEVFLMTFMRDSLRGTDEIVPYLYVLEYNNMKIRALTADGLEFGPEEYDADGHLVTNIITSSLCFNNTVLNSKPKKDRDDGVLVQSHGRDYYVYPYGFLYRSIGVQAKSKNGVFASYQDPATEVTSGGSGSFYGDQDAMTWYDEMVKATEEDLADIGLESLKGIIPFTYRDADAILSHYYDKTEEFNSYEEYNRVSFHDYTTRAARKNNVEFWEYGWNDGHSPQLFDYRNLSALQPATTYYNYIDTTPEEVLNNYLFVLGVNTKQEVVDYVKSLLEDYKAGRIPIESNRYKWWLESVIENIPSDLTVEVFDDILQDYCDELTDEGRYSLTKEEYLAEVRRADAIYGYNIVFERPFNEIEKQYVMAHMKSCGITNRNYLENFAMAVNLCSSIYTTEGCTTESPETYRKKLVFHFFIHMFNLSQEV